MNINISLRLKVERSWFSTTKNAYIHAVKTLSDGL